MVLQGRGKLTTTWGLQEGRTGDLRELSWHGKSAKGLTIERLLEAILLFSHSSNICVPLLCDEFPGKVLHLSERQGSFWVKTTPYLLKGVFRKHDLQSRSAGGQRHQVPLQH